MRINSDDATYIVNNDDIYDNIDNIYDNVDDSYYIRDVDGTFIFDFDKVIAEAKSQKSFITPRLVFIVQVTPIHFLNVSLE